MLQIPQEIFFEHSFGFVQINILYLIDTQTTLPLKNRQRVRREAALPRLQLLGPFIETHRSAFRRPRCAKPGWHLTFKQRGKTRTVYAPLALVGKVKSWTRTYPRLKKLMRQIIRHSLL